MNPITIEKPVVDINRIYQPIFSEPSSNEEDIHRNLEKVGIPKVESSDDEDFFVIMKRLRRCMKDEDVEYMPANNVDDEDENIMDENVRRGGDFNCLKGGIQVEQDEAGGLVAMEDDQAGSVEADQVNQVHVEQRIEVASIQVD